MQTHRITFLLAVIPLIGMGLIVCMPALGQLNQEIFTGKERHREFGPYISCRLQVPFKVMGGELALCKKDIFLPWESLYLIAPTSANKPVRLLFEIDDLAKLRGYVSIQMPQQALEFVRLRTGLSTYTNFVHKYNSHQVEVMARDTDPTDFPDGYWGMLDRKVMKRLHIAPATCQQSGKGFVVKRTLFVEKLRPTKDAPRARMPILRRVQEWVGRDGEYRIEKQTELPVPAGPRWEIPKGA